MLKLATSSKVSKETIKCQNCLKSGHWTYECKNPTVIPKCVSRIKQLRSKSFKQKFNEDVGPEDPGGSMLHDDRRFGKPSSSKIFEPDATKNCRSPTIFSSSHSSTSSSSSSSCKSSIDIHKEPCEISSNGEKIGEELEATQRPQSTKTKVGAVKKQLEQFNSSNASSEPEKIRKKNNESWSNVKKNKIESARLNDYLDQGGEEGNKKEHDQEFDRQEVHKLYRKRLKRNNDEINSNHHAKKENRKLHKHEKGVEDGPWQAYDGRNSRKSKLQSINKTSSESRSEKKRDYRRGEKTSQRLSRNHKRSLSRDHC